MEAFLVVSFLLGLSMYFLSALMGEGFLWLAVFFALASVPVGTAAIIYYLKQIAQKMDVLIQNKKDRPKEKE